MAGADTLRSVEIAMIKTMLALRPELTKQAILSYFTRPGRDLNHRLISQIANGLWPEIAPAPLELTLAYMADCLARPGPLKHADLDEQDQTAMPTRLATIDLTWWPVGQGLFWSGRLAGARSGTFNWVYDCGSSSGAKERDAAIRRFRQRLGGQPIDVVVLSHFDRDHINGIVALIRGVSVRTLLLPYIPLWQRLLIAIGEGLTEADAAFGFYLDPAAFLAGIDGGGIGEVVFVPAAGPDDVVPGPEDPIDPDPGIEGGKPEYGSPPPGSEDDPAILPATNIEVRFLQPQGRIVVPSLWEFVPYNDASMQPLTSPTFVSQAKALAKNFLDHPAQRSSTLQKLKQLYQHTFGAGSTPANLISLFLYSGPVGARIEFDAVAATAPFARRHGQDNLAQLATGDGYVDDPARLAALQRFFSAGRIARAGLFQVMHHGSRENWQDGLGAAFKPAASIFSSDPGFTHGHPHPEVLRDFWPWYPVRVDKHSGFGLIAVLQTP
ncbi:hypothetical protein [Sphingomonas sp. CARO-RG-8B-R24-01]|uniref:hypothetical protein n=1 Tax=Sphingomonas sp. CARO-RG-8B-R24-01 TaxID=2914831 RepID=UPI001F55C0CB|nr:hypothetical protein [Sphingomonas sp. CARO-RG-8B-R24-01]